MQLLDRPGPTFKKLNKLRPKSHTPKNNTTPSNIIYNTVVKFLNLTSNRTLDHLNILKKGPTYIPPPQLSTIQQQINNNIIESGNVDPWLIHWHKNHTLDLKIYYDKIKQAKIDISELKSLEQHNNIIILKADKNNCLVAMNITNYKEECYRQLSDNNYYTRIAQSKQADNIISLNEILSQHHNKKTISNATYNKLILETTYNYNTRKFYILPKIHKPKHKWPNELTPPGRPIINNKHTELTNICIYLEKELKPYSKTLKYTITNSDQLIHDITVLNEKHTTNTSTPIIC